jgi:hypothetical protein
MIGVAHDAPGLTEENVDRLEASSDPGGIIRPRKPELGTSSSAA